MKKFLAILMAAFLFTTVVGCGDKPKEKDAKPKADDKKADDKKPS